MALYIFLMIIFLLCIGATISGTLAERAMLHDRPRIYWDESFMRLINLFWVPALLLFIVLMAMEWLITLIITVIALFLGKPILKSLAEFILVLPLANILIKNRG